MINMTCTQHEIDGSRLIVQIPTNLFSGESIDRSVNDRGIEDFADKAESLIEENPGIATLVCNALPISPGERLVSPQRLKAYKEIMNSNVIIVIHEIDEKEEASPVAALWATFAHANMKGNVVSRQDCGDSLVAVIDGIIALETNESCGSGFKEIVEQALFDAYAKLIVTWEIENCMTPKTRGFATKFRSGLEKACDEAGVTVQRTEGSQQERDEIMAQTKKEDASPQNDTKIHARKINTIDIGSGISLHVDDGIHSINSIPLPISKRTDTDEEMMRILSHEHKDVVNLVERVFDLDDESRSGTINQILNSTVIITLRHIEHGAIGCIWGDFVNLNGETMNLPSEIGQNANPNSVAAVHGVISLDEGVEESLGLGKDTESILFETFIRLMLLWGIESVGNAPSSDGADKLSRAAKAVAAQSNLNLRISEACFNEEDNSVTPLH